MASRSTSRSRTDRLEMGPGSSLTSSRPRARSASASIPTTSIPRPRSQSVKSSSSATAANPGASTTSSRPPSRANSVKSNYSSRSLSVNEREVIRDRDENCLFCGMGAAAGSQVAHIMSRTRQADHEVEWMRTFMAQEGFSKRHAENLMLLCPTHHGLYDNGSYAIVPSEKNLAYMIAFERRDFERRESLLSGGRPTPTRHYDAKRNFTGRTVPPLDDLEPIIEILWMHGSITTLQFGDHNLQIHSSSTTLPQLISWAPLRIDKNSIPQTPRKLRFYPSPYGYQALMDISLPSENDPTVTTSDPTITSSTASSIRVNGGHRVSPYALFARSFSTITRATFPVNTRVAYMTEMILYLRGLYNRIPGKADSWAFDNPWIARPTFPALSLSFSSKRVTERERGVTERGRGRRKGKEFDDITWKSLETHPSYERGAELKHESIINRSASSHGSSRDRQPSGSTGTRGGGQEIANGREAIRQGHIVGRAGLFGEALSAATKDRRIIRPTAHLNRQRTVSVGPPSTRADDSVRPPMALIPSGLVGAASGKLDDNRLQPRIQSPVPPTSRDHSPDPSNGYTTEYESSRDPIDIILNPNPSASKVSTSQTIPTHTHSRSDPDSNTDHNSNRPAHSRSRSATSNTPNSLGQHLAMVRRVRGVIRAGSISRGRGAGRGGSSTSQNEGPSTSINRNSRSDSALASDSFAAPFPKDSVETGARRSRSANRSTIDRDFVDSRR